MDSQLYFIINSEAVCENKILWDGITEWEAPENTLVISANEIKMDLDIGDVASQDILL